MDWMAQDQVQSTLLFYLKIHSDFLKLLFKNMKGNLEK